MECNVKDYSISNGCNDFTNEELIERYRSGEKRVIDEIILKNTGIINAFIWKNKWMFQNSTTMSVDDYFQEGVLALYEAIEKYDSERGSFSSFAFMILRARLFRVFREKDKTIRIPSWRYDEFNKFKKNEAAIAAYLGRDPSLKELARFSGYSADEILAFRSDFKRITSLNTPMSDEADSGTIGDYVMDSYNYFEDVEKELYLQQLRKDLDEAMNTLLTKEQKKILCASIGWTSRIQVSDEVIAGRYNISTIDVRKSLKKSLNKLRYGSSKYLAKNYGALISYEISRYSDEDSRAASRVGMMSKLIGAYIKQGDTVVINGYKGVMECFVSYGAWFQFRYIDNAGSERLATIAFRSIKDYVIGEDRITILRVREDLDSQIHIDSLSSLGRDAASQP